MKEIVYFMKRVIGDITSKRIVFGFGVLLFVLLVALLWVIFSDSMVQDFRRIPGTMSKAKIIRLIGWAMGGAFVAIGIAVLSQRTEAQTRTAEAQIENNRLIEKGHMQERFKTATEHLGHNNAAVRIAAFYEFLHLINDNGGEYRKSILDILYAHMRTTTADFANRQDVKEAKRKNEPIKPTEEIQRVLDILFKSPDIDRNGIEPNLRGGYFLGADLSGADLSKVNLSGAELHGVDLSGANLSGANMSKTWLGGACYTNETRFPEWFEPPIAPPDNGDKVQFPEGFVAPEKPKSDK